MRKNFFYGLALISFIISISILLGILLNPTIPLPTKMLLSSIPITIIMVCILIPFFLLYEYGLENWRHVPCPRCHNRSVFVEAVREDSMVFYCIICNQSIAYKEMKKSYESRKFVLNK